MPQTAGEWEFDDMLHMPGGGFIVAQTPDGSHPDIYLATIVDEDEEGRFEPDVEKQRCNGRLMAAASKMFDVINLCLKDAGAGGQMTDATVVAVLEASHAISRPLRRSSLPMPSVPVASYNFVGTVTGDCECFMWGQVSAEDHLRVVGQEAHDRDLEFEEKVDHLYPNDLFTKLEEDKKYRFEIKVFEVPDELPPG